MRRAGAPAVTGTATEDQVLTADTSSIADADGLGTLHYQWQRDSGSGFGNVGPDQANYTLGDADVGATLRVVVNYTDGNGTAESIVSAATAAVANVNDAPSGAPTIAGAAVEDQVITADTSSIADADALGALHYQWQRDSGSGFGNVGLDQASYTLDDADVGATLRVVVNYTDGNGTAESIVSAATAAVANVNDAPSGAPTIAGAAVEDQVITADTSTIADADALGALHYQWQRDSGSGFASVGLDQASYTLGDADIDATLRVVVNYTDGNGTAESLTSAPTAVIANVNDAPTGAPIVIGTATEDQVLTADTSSIADADGLGTLHYQWQRDSGSGFSNVGLDQASYTLGDADVGAALQVAVSYTDGNGTAESLTSAPTAVIANINDAPSGAPIVIGTATEDQVLTADTSSIADADGLGTLHYQWQRDSGSGFASVGLDQSSYRLDDADVGATLRVVLSYTDDNGTAESLTSAPTAAVANVNDAPTGSPTIVGTTTEDQVLQVLTADASAIADDDGLGTLHYQWQRNFGSGFSDVGPDQASYSLGDADVGATMRVVVSYTDGHGTAESLVSAPTEAVANVNDAPTGAPAVIGTATEDQVLTADTSTITDADGVGTLHYQWQRDSGSGFGAIGHDEPTYTLGEADVGATMRVAVSYTDGNGTTESLTSAATAVVTNVNDGPSGGPTVTGTPREDQVLAADTSSIADADGLGTLHYQWQRNSGLGFASVGLGQASYTLGDADVGATMRVVVSYTDSNGTAESLDQRANRGGGQRQRCADWRAGRHRHGDRGSGPQRQHLDHRRCRRARHAALPVAAQQRHRLRQYRPRPGDLHPGRRRRRRRHAGGGQLHRRARHGGVPDQRGDRGGRPTSTRRRPVRPP